MGDNGGMEITIYDKVYQGLQKAKGRWPEVAAESGLPYKTVKNVGTGHTTNPTIHTLFALEKGLDAVLGKAASVAS